MGLEQGEIVAMPAENEEMGMDCSRVWMLEGEVEVAGLVWRVG